MGRAIASGVRTMSLRWAGVALAALALAVPPICQAQSNAYPNKPVRVIVPQPPGGGFDFVGRLLADRMGKAMGQNFIVENRPGSGTLVGTDAAAKSAPDGYTFVLGTNATHAANEFLFPALGFNPATDFEAVAMLGLLPMVICTSASELPANGIAELVARARAKPGTLNVGLPSTTANVVLAQFVKAAQAPLFGVKYKSSGQAMTDLLGGQIPLAIDTATAARPLIASGKLRALGVTSLKATEMLPGVKPVSEQGVPGFEVVAWDALFAPRGTPAEIVEKMAEHVQRALQLADTRRRLMEIGVEPLFMGPAQLDAFVKAERPKWGDVIKAADIRVD